MLKCLYLQPAFVQTHEFLLHKFLKPLVLKPRSNGCDAAVNSSSSGAQKPIVAKAKMITNSEIIFIIAALQ